MSKLENADQEHHVPDKSKSKTGSAPAWMWWIGIAIGLLLILSVAYTTWPEKKKNSGKAAGLANAYQTTYVLQPGKPIRVLVPLYYDYECSGGGKTYYHRPQNHDWQLVGGGIPYTRPSEHAAYFDLNSPDEEITVVVNFTKL